MNELNDAKMELLEELEESPESNKKQLLIKKILQI